MPTADDLKKFFAAGERAGAPAGARIGAAPIGSRITQAILGSGVLDQPIARLLLGSDATKARMQDPLAAAAPSEAIMIGSRSPMFNRDAAKGFTEALRKIPVAGRQHPNIVQNLWERFRTFKGPDNRLRQEISDEGLKIDTGYPDELSRMSDRSGRSKIRVEHPELERAYPGLLRQLDIRNSDVGVYDPGAAGFYRPYAPGTKQPAGEIVLMRVPLTDAGPQSALEKALVKHARTLSPEQMHAVHQRTMAHELQHAVQQLENFPRGANLHTFSFLPAAEQAAFRARLARELAAINKATAARAKRQEAPRGWDTVGATELPDNAAYEFYRRTPGEAEARAVAERIGYDRLNALHDVAPPFDYDIPFSQLHRRRR